MRGQHGIIVARRDHVVPCETGRGFLAERLHVAVRSVVSRLSFVQWTTHTFLSTCRLPAYLASSPDGLAERSTVTGCSNGRCAFKHVRLRVGVRIMSQLGEAANGPSGSGG